MRAMRSLIIVMVISYYSFLPRLNDCCYSCNSNLAVDFAFTMLNKHFTNNRKGKVSQWEYRLLMAIDIASFLGFSVPADDGDQVDHDGDQVDQVSVDIIDEAVAITHNIDSEYCATRSDDMYGFGVALMEIITGKPMCQISEGVQYGLLTQWVSSMFGNGEIESIVDPKLKGEFDMNSMEEAIKIAMACVFQNSEQYPTMDQLVIQLNECLQIERARLMDGGLPFVSLDSIEISLNETN